MRTDWKTSRISLELGREAAEQLLATILPSCSVSKIEPAQGGLANANYRIQIAGEPQPVLLRLYLRNPSQARKEYALSRTLERRVPMARVLHFADTNSVTGQPYAVIQWIAGERLETLCHGLRPEDLADIGRSLGAALAEIHSVTFARHGLLSGDLQVVQPFAAGGEGLLSFLRECLIHGAGGRRIGVALTADLMKFAQKHASLLDSWTGPPCLAHGDFGGSNILVRSTGNPAHWNIAAILDWEFACSATPFLDLGNLLRPPLDARGFGESVAQGYTGAGGILPDSWRALSLLADLFAWAEFLNRPVLDQTVVDDARARIVHTMQALGQSTAR